MEHQGPRRYAYVQILVDHKDITDRVSPYLISVQVISVQNEQDRCNIELDDRNAELLIPGDEADIQVVMGWRHEGPRIINVGASMDKFKMGSYNEAKFGGPGAELVFDGYLANVESGFGRQGGGRRLWLECEGGHPHGKAKEGQNDSIGEGKKRDADATETGEGGTGPLGAAEAAEAAAALAGPGIDFAKIAKVAVGAGVGATVTTLLGPAVGLIAGGTASVVTGKIAGALAGSGSGQTQSEAPTAEGVLTSEGFLTDAIGDKDKKDAPGTFSEGKIPLMEAGTQFFGKAGMTLKLSPEMMKIRRNYWGISNESVMAWGQRIAREVGGTFKISGNVASIVGKNEGVNVDGEEMPVIEAVWGINLIGWRIKPFVARPQFGSAASRYFDLDAGEWKQTDKSIKEEFPFGQVQAIFVSMAAEADKNVAEQKNQGNAAQGKWERGVGWCLFNGDPRAKTSANLTIRGARPGIDGTYTMEEVEHNYQRGVGYTTRAVVRAPVPDTSNGTPFGGDPGKQKEAPSLSEPAEPYVPEPKKPGETQAQWLKRILTGTEVGRIEGRYKAGFISRAEADRQIAAISRRNFSAEEQARIKQYDQERRQGYAQ